VAAAALSNQAHLKVGSHVRNKGRLKAAPTIAGRS